MRRFVVGNWKCHKSSADARAWFAAFAGMYQPCPDVMVVVAPPFICLEGVADFVRGLGLKNVALAAQDISPFPKGAYTGAVAADMVKGMVEYVIIGHSDRRRYFHETTQDIVNKVSETVDAGLVPIICIDQPDMLLQLRALHDIDCGKMIIAYGPVDALNFRIPQAPEHVVEAAARIHRILPGRPVIYGGSVNPENMRQFAHLDGVAGLFIGASSLDAASFVAIGAGLATPNSV